jgi:hypothetical protein
MNLDNMSTDKFVFKYEEYPLIQIRFAHKNKKTPLIEALLDSGGDFIVIPLPIAKYLGAKLKKAESVNTAGGVTTLFKTKLDIIIGKSKKKKLVYKGLEVFVLDKEDIPVLVGRRPFFEDFEITFKKHKKQLVLKKVKKE